MTDEQLLTNLQKVYDVLLKGTNSVPDWDRLAGLSAVGEVIRQLAPSEASDE